MKRILCLMAVLLLVAASAYAATKTVNLPDQHITVRVYGSAAVERTPTTIIRSFISDRKIAYSSDGGIVSGDIAGTNGCRQRGTHRLEGCQRTAGSSGFVKNTSNGTLHGIAKLPQLHKAAADAQVQAHTDDAGHGRNTPDKAIQKVIYFCNEIGHKSSN